MLTPIQSLLLLAHVVDAYRATDVQMPEGDAPVPAMLQALEQANAVLQVECMLDPEQGRYYPQMAANLNESSILQLWNYAQGVFAESPYQVPDFDAFAAGFRRKLVEYGPLDLDACCDAAANHELRYAGDLSWIGMMEQAARKADAEGAFTDAFNRWVLAHFARQTVAVAAELRHELAAEGAGNGE
jgi:hypothetical protein